MIISVLTENTAKNEHYKCEHGLCLHIATEKHKILFDTGATALFTENAATMDIDLSKVDAAILSHGHLDHGGGSGPFSKSTRKRTYTFRKGLSVRSI